MIIKEAQAMKRTLPRLRFLPVSCDLLKWSLKVYPSKVHLQV
jgi:hypothetical protein